MYAAFELQLCLLQRHEVLSPQCAGVLKAAGVVEQQQLDGRMNYMTTQCAEVHPGRRTILCVRTIGIGADRTGTVKRTANDEYMNTDYSDIEDPQTCRLASTRSNLVNRHQALMAPGPAAISAAALPAVAAAAAVLERPRCLARWC